MSYQDELNKFFKQRAGSFKQEGINLHIDKKMDFTYAHIECTFESLPKDAKWIEVDDGHYWDSRYESESGIGEYDFRGNVNLYYADFNFDFSTMDKDDRKKYLEYLNDETGIDGNLGDWSGEYDDNAFLNNGIHYQFAYGNYSINNKEYNDYLILSPELEYGEPWNGRHSEENYEGYKIYHPEENKFVPVILAGGDHVAECAALDVVLNNDKPLPWIEIDKVKDYISRLEL